jgi:hypothetical protein
MDNFVSKMIYSEVDTWNPYIMTEVIKSIFAIMGEKEIEIMIEELNDSLLSYDEQYRLRIDRKSTITDKEPSNG